ncbi:MAG: hypothetical protein JWN04_2020, partial [Myxococcaceae bacterium]|nr:hypothetical protein [Myxococcaceae bacterium]
MQRRANSSTAVVPRNLAARAAAYALVGFAILAPQLLGGANEKACLAILLIGSVVCLGVSLSLRQTVRSLGVVPHAAAATLLAAVWTLAQVVPIPCSLAVWLHGELGQRVRTLAQLEGASPTWCTISVAPGSTRVALAVAVLVCALLLAATALARAGQRSALMYGIALSSVAMAAVAVAHTVFAADSVFGVYQPEAARPGLLLAPLLNGNHLAGHLALGLPLCISFAMEAKGVDARVSWWTLSFLVLTTGLFTLSRAGSAVLLAGATASFAAQLSRKEGAARNVENRVAWFAGAACIAAAAYFTLDVLTPEFRGQTAPFRKIAMQLPVLKIALEHPLTGIGRGALGDVTPGFVLTDTRVLYAENILVQWLSEW